MNPTLMVGAVVAILVIGAVVVLGMGARNTGDSSMTAEDINPANDNSDMVADEGPLTDEELIPENAIEVEGGNFSFSPNEIRVKAGEPVTIKLNSADLMHNFVVDELNVRTEVVKAGTFGVITFTPTEPGEYEFYCGVGSHRANGMVGTLIVE